MYSYHTSTTLELLSQFLESNIQKNSGVGAACDTMKSMKLFTGEHPVASRAGPGASPQPLVEGAWKYLRSPSIINPNIWGCPKIGVPPNHPTFDNFIQFQYSNLWFLGIPHFSKPSYQWISSGNPISFPLIQFWDSGWSMMEVSHGDSLWSGWATLGPKIMLKWHIYIFVCVPACVVHIYLATRCWTRPYTGHKKEQIQCYTQSRFSGVSHLQLGAMYSTDQPP